MNLEIEPPTEKSASAPSDARWTGPGTRWWIAAFAAFFLSVIPAVIWPGDVTWVNDEPRIIANAWHANAAHQLASRGLYGNFGFAYGPLPTWIYQGLLAVTHDPVTLAGLRALLCASVTSLSLLWLARTLGFQPWYVVAISLAPRIWQYQRVLWDASFGIPMSALALAGFVAYGQKQTRLHLIATLAPAILLPFIHPQGLPLSTALLGTLLLCARADLWAKRFTVAITVALVAAFHAPYLAELAGAISVRLGQAVHHGYPNGQSPWQSALAPLLGGNLLSDCQFTGDFFEPLGPPAVSTAASLFSRLIYPLGWIGVAVILAQSISYFQKPSRGAPNALGLLSLAALTSLLLHAALFGAMRVPPQPQYFFGTFAIQAILPWIALERLRRAGIIVLAIYGLSVGWITSTALWAIHRQGYAGPRPPFKLADQARLASDLAHFSDTTAWTDIPQFYEYPQSLRCLRLLVPPLPNATTSNQRILFSGGTAEQSIRLSLSAKTIAPPASWKEIEIVPLPSGWSPSQ